jgi:hypothetical protein
MNPGLGSSRELRGDQLMFQKLSGTSGISIEVSEALESFREMN